jgi:cyclic pyranopterin phosphate synthase
VSALSITGTTSFAADLRDAFDRRIRYLRVSLTDRCNYRCLYCMPDEGVEVSPKSELLSADEVVHLVGLFVQHGVRRVRITGGEPTVRRDLIELVRMLGRLGLEDLAMTTNGERLSELARPLREAGLLRLNVSLDSLDANRFRRITRRGDLARVLAGITAADDAGFRHTKLNVVVMGGQNEDELPALCRFAWAHDLVPRFIEFMPMSEGALFSPGGFVSAAAIRARLETEFGALERDPADGLPGIGPAQYLRVRSEGGGRRLGIIAAVTEPFCDTCNRVRLSATGRLHTCLALEHDADLRSLLRGGVNDDELWMEIERIIGEKKRGHEFTSCGQGASRKNMVAIGG